MPTLPVSPNGVARPWAAAATVYSSARQAGLGPGQPTLGVDVQALHRAEVEDDPALGRAVAGQAVAAAADRQLEAGLAGEDDGPRDVAGVGRLDDQRRATVDLREVDLAGVVVGRRPRADDRPGEAGDEGGDVGAGAGRRGWGCGRGPWPVVSFRVGCAFGLGCAAMVESAGCPSPRADDRDPDADGCQPGCDG